MKKSEFIDRTLTRLFETFMPPGMEEARSRILERENVSDETIINRAAWELYEYSDEDQPEIRHKLRAAVQEVITETGGGGQVEIGLLAPEEMDAEIERVFGGRKIGSVLLNIVDWAEEQGYEVERPPQGSESVLDWRIDGRRLTLIDE